MGRIQYQQRQTQQQQAILFVPEQVPKLHPQIVRIKIYFILKTS
jgi:hypothetical protein